MNKADTTPPTPSSARHTLGIDLGTTPCALSWLDPQDRARGNPLQSVLTYFAHEVSA